MSIFDRFKYDRDYERDEGYDDPLETDVPPMRYIKERMGIHDTSIPETPKYGVSDTHKERIKKKKTT